jgi:hypothetical protein
MTVNKVMFPDGTEMDANGATCEACGESLANHGCGSSGGTGSVTTVTTRSYGPRKKVEEHPTCPHCGGRIHFNMGATAVNSECLNRQYSLDVGEMANPNDRLPVMTLERMGAIFEWGKALTTPPSYGKMESAAGGAATYSGLRPKTGRKKKAVAASAGERIEDIAGSVEAPAPKGKKGKGKGKRAAASAEASVEVGGTAPSTDEASAVAAAEQIVAPKKGKGKKAPASGAEIEVTEIPTENGVAVSKDTAEESEADRRRRERQERRKALLAQRS